MFAKNSKILVTGARGLVGSALIEELQKQGYTNLVLFTRDVCDLTSAECVKQAFLKERPDVVFHTAASVFGIGGNLKNRGSIFLDNVLMNTHVIEASRLAGVKKVVAMGTIAAYPEPKITPIKEEHIWEGAPHGSESSYAHAKRAMLAQLLAYNENYGLDFSYVISTNLYGKNDKFDSKLGHVIPSLIRKFYEAQKDGTDVTIWGNGTAARDFLYSEDMARALVLIMNKFTGPINVASGRCVMIKEVAEILASYFGMEGRVKWDSAMPNGRSFHEIDLSALKSIGFEPTFTIKEGLKETLDWFSTKYEENLIRL